MTDERELDRFAAEVRAAIDAWERAVAEAQPIESELLAAAKQQRYHPHWEVLRATHARLTELGMQCLTDKQRRRPAVENPFSQLELLQPTEGAA